MQSSAIRIHGTSQAENSSKECVLSVAIHEMAFNDSIGLWNVLCCCKQSLANVACQMAADVAHLVRLQPWNWDLARLIAAPLLCAFLMLLQWRV